MGEADADTACTYCGSDVFEHDPLFLEEREEGERIPAGQFCNYACLQAHIEDNGLVTGACCNWNP